MGREAFTLFVPATECMIAFPGISIRSVSPIPINPAHSPMIKVSALNTLEMFFFEAPIALSMPIYFVLSRTEIYVIIPIIMEETISETATKAIRT